MASNSNKEMSMKELFNDVSKYKNMAVEMPPMNVQILVKKSTYKIHNEAKVIVLDSDFAEQIDHVEDLLSHGFDCWVFVNDEDDYEWDAKQSARDSFDGGF